MLHIVLRAASAAALLAMVSAHAAEYGSAVVSRDYNPAVSLILNGWYAGFSRDPETYRIAGFSPEPEVLELEEGFQLGGTELTASANIDDQFYGQFTAGLHHGEVEVEEAFVQTLALGHGFTLRAGLFLPEVGYLNPVHAHAWDFVDLPLPYLALIGRHNLSDTGVQVRWVAPTPIFLELGAETLRGEAFPAAGAANDGTGAANAFLRLGGDVGVSHAWRLGLSHFSADAEDRASGDEEEPDFFTGDVDLTVVDFVWKWTPQGNPSSRNFEFQAEYLRRDEDGTYFLGGGGPTAAFAGEQKGWYGQAVYQFMPRWRAGVRYAQADAGAVSPAFVGTVLDAEGHQPRATSLMLDFANSEFSRVRLQYTRDEARNGEPDHQYYLQYVMSLGAHGAHAF